MTEDQRNAPTLPAPPLELEPSDVDTILAILLAADFALEGCS
jgi:hypothetical protein